MIRDTAAQDRPISPTPHRRRWLVAGVLGAIAALGLAAPALLRLGSAQASVSASRLTIATVERGALVRDVAGEGKVVAAVSPTLYATEGGAVVLQVHAGDAVKKGQLLAVIDSPTLTNRLAQERSNADALQAEALRAEVDARQRRAALQSAWESAKVDEQGARNELARQQKAFDAGASSGMQVERARDAMEKARIALSHAEANLGLNDDSLRFEVRAKQLAAERQRLLVKDLERQVDQLQLRSPVDGQVGQLFVAERATVAKDAQLLSVIDLSALEVQMQVPESYARDLAIGMPGEITGNGKTWAGRVSAVSPEVVNGQVAARLRFDGDTPEQLRQNQRLSVRVLIERRENVLRVARGSFVEEFGGRFAYVLRDGIAEKSPLRLGTASVAHVEVLEGLQAGDRVVVSGSDAFGEQARVAVSP
ncbi:efflux RND transporter periplasmic adaptor subunit [Caldimonas sp. KR1-144]|uniref:efflux RND transporter periplasmic adaptor subunit n=1 Tax=Caldimonas sp. KR1-144 TaxID=3400911 RepID=UPI003C08BEA4